MENEHVTDNEEVIQHILKAQTALLESNLKTLKAMNIILGVILLDITIRILSIFWSLF